jgi:hypothetical protein
MHDAFRCLPPEVDAEPCNGPSVCHRQEEHDIGASFGEHPSDVVRLDRLLAIPFEFVEIPLAERPNLDREVEVESHTSSMEVTFSADTFVAQIEHELMPPAVPAAPGGRDS